MITISDEIIKSIAQEFGEYLDYDEDDSPPNAERVTIAVENWFLRIINEITQSPLFYAPGPGGYMNCRVPGFVPPDELECIYFGWAACDKPPLDGQIYCQEHHTKMIEE